MRKKFWPIIIWRLERKTAKPPNLNPHEVFRLYGGVYCLDQFPRFQWLLKHNTIDLGLSGDKFWNVEQFVLLRGHQWTDVWPAACVSVEYIRVHSGAPRTSWQVELRTSDRQMELIIIIMCYNIFPSSPGVHIITGTILALPISVVSISVWLCVECTWSYDVYYVCIKLMWLFKQYDEI